MLVTDLFKCCSRIEAENLFLRHQLNYGGRRPVCACLAVIVRDSNRKLGLKLRIRRCAIS